MSDEGEKTCPLCAEEMDLTDQQLKPCKCGYEICVWCWHHIMDMAEKDETEGRCPACRSPYDKEKIVGTAAKCERLVAEIGTERKLKNQKAKTKSTEGRKQLSSVRVIQRNLVYIVGLALNLADEELLNGREYFGQYGKVLKVSMSRTAAGTIQQFPNNTCSVYITYSKEEEAIRCIQNVHGFVLDGKPLRACFGTTKYCHAWLRNMPCTNPDCLYLHEIGSQEDSFTKDEIISAYTRSRVQQVTGAANNMQRRSGSFLPPPLDDYTNHSSGKTIVQSASNNSTSIVRGSPPNGISGRSVALPAAAAWGTRAPSSQPHTSGAIGTEGPSNPTPDKMSSTLASSSAVVGSVQAASLHSDEVKRKTITEETHDGVQPKSKTELLKPLNQPVSMDSQSCASNESVGDKPPLAVPLSSPLLPKDPDRLTSMAASSNTYVGSLEDQESISSSEVRKLCSDIPLIDIGKESRADYGLSRHDGLVSDHNMIKSPQNQVLQQQNLVSDNSRESLIATAAGNTSSPVNGLCTSRENFDFDSISQVQDTGKEVEDDILSFDNQRLNDPEVICRAPYMANSAFHLSNHARPLSLQQNEPYNDASVNIGFVPVDNRDSRASNVSLVHPSSTMANGYLEKFVGSSSSGFDRTLGHSLSFLEREKRSSGRYFGEMANTGSNAVDMGESNIISDILSLDFDPSDGSLTSPHNLAKLMSDTDEQSGTLKLSNSWKAHSNNQSKFSFARQEEPNSQACDMRPSLNPIDPWSMDQSVIQDFSNRDLYMERKRIDNNISSSRLNEFENIGSSHPFVHPANNSAVSRVQISAPPGFSIPNRLPPPGFSTQDRIDQAFDSISGKSLLDAALRNSYQTPASENTNSTRDIGFMDPAILAVGEGRVQSYVNNVGLDTRSNVPSQLNVLDNEAKLQFLMQRSLSGQQSLGLSEMGNRFTRYGDSYGVPSRLLDQSQISNLSPYAQLPLQQSGNTMFSSDQWNGWNDLQGGNGMEVANLLRNERLGSNKFYAGYDDPKYRVPNSGNLYNRTFRM